MNTVAIIGVGLIGGSFGLALRKAGFRGRILGVNGNETIRAALDRGAIDAGTSLGDAVSQADLIYLAQPIAGILETLRSLDPLVRPGALITDAGSTKDEISRVAQQCIRRCQFLGGHPMAGKEKRGVQEAEADLFTGRTYVLTPDNPQETETVAARALIDWLRRIGARVMSMRPNEHDCIVAFTSHLPQLVSTALAATVGTHSESERELEIAGPGLTDMTRLALSSYDLWRDILATNREAIDEALAVYIQKLTDLRRKLKGADIEAEFEMGAALAARVRRLGSPGSTRR